MQSIINKEKERRRQKKVPEAKNNKSDLKVIGNSISSKASSHKYKINVTFDESQLAAKKDAFREALDKELEEKIKSYIESSKPASGSEGLQVIREESMDVSCKEDLSDLPEPREIEKPRDLETQGQAEEIKQEAFDEQELKEEAKQFPDELFISEENKYNQNEKSNEEPKEELKKELNEEIKEEIKEEAKMEPI
mmetsp:Transcript_41958/g.48585  ORF Transcript_41958/g.48585 Transcript_41958/m.48585 type:complete len:194 (-) Transcript_41958:718-1299(-)